VIAEDAKYGWWMVNGRYRVAIVVLSPLGLRLTQHKLPDLFRA
jgi:hypothetical protein